MATILEANTLERISSLPYGIPVIGNVAAEVWTTPTLEIGNAFLLQNVPLPGDCSVSCGTRFNVDKVKIPGKNKQLLKPRSKDSTTVYVTSQLRTYFDALLMSTVLLILNNDNEQYRKRTFIHPSTLALGVREVYLESINVSRYTPVDGGYVTFTFIDARSASNFNTEDVNDIDNTLPKNDTFALEVAGNL